MKEDKINKILVYLAPGFEEIEAVTIIDLLRRAELEVIVAGLQPDQVTGSHGISLVPDIFYVDVDPDDYDCLVLPGGQPGSSNLKANVQVLETVKKYHREKKLIAAICAAPTVLTEAGVLKNRKVTSYPDNKSTFSDSDYQELSVVRDGMIVTSRGVGTAIAFVLELIKIIKDETTANKLSARILWEQPNS